MKKRILFRAFFLLLAMLSLSSVEVVAAGEPAVVSWNGINVGGAESVADGMKEPVGDTFDLLGEDVDVANDQILNEVQASAQTGQQEEYPVATTLDLFALNWEEETDEMINHYVGMTEWNVIGNWLSSLSDEERERLLARDTVLVQETEILPAGSQEPIQMLYYEYALQQYQKSMMMRAACPLQTSGYWQTKIVQTNAMGTPVRTAIITYKVSGVDTSVPTTQRQSVTIAKSVSSNWCNISWKNEKEDISTYKESEAGATYPYVKAYINFNKPAGYKVSVSYNIDTGFRKLYWNPTETFDSDQPLFLSGGILSADRKEYPSLTTYNNKSTAGYLSGAYSGRHYVCSIVNMYMNAGIGTTANPTEGNVVQTITLSPCNYQVGYNGNGATQGAVSSQNCVYDVGYLTQPNGFLKSYTVTYDGNGGTPAVSSQKASAEFRGWGCNQKNTVTYEAGKSFSNLAAEDGAVVTMYALWNPGSVLLPDAEREGYQFIGWNLGNAGVRYTPTKDCTATAKWKANTYRIEFQSAGGTECESLNAAYDQEIDLPVPERSGYHFNGWRGGNGIYVGSVKNLTAENEAIVTLTADWTANTDTPYTIKHYKQPSRDVKNHKDYLLFSKASGDALDGESVLQGTTDATITVAPQQIDGYITPNSQTVQIKGDGSLCVSFYYDLEEEVMVQNPQLGSNEDPWDEIARRIAAGLSFSLEMNGANYEIKQNEDGTLRLVFISADQPKVVIPDVLTIGEKTYRITEINEKAFFGNKNIKEVELSANISKIGNSAFEGCSGLEKITLRKGLVSIGKNAFKNCTSLKSVKMPSTVQSIGDSAFQNCTKMTKVTLNEGLLKIGKKAFYGCAKLKKIHIPKSVLKILSYAFGKCKKMEKVTFADASQLLTMGTGVMSGCEKLTKIKLPSKLTNIPAKAFYGCKKLKSVTGGGAVTKIGESAFQKCVKISKITISSKVQTIGKKAFYQCSGLKKVTIKSKALTSVGTKAFKKCKKGITFVVPKSKKGAYSRMFRGKY